MTVSDKLEKKIRKGKPGQYAGRSIIERIESQMDKRRKAMENMIVDYGQPVDMPESERVTYWTNHGRYEGLAAALAILRTSSVTNEIQRSNERLGIE